MKEIDNFRICFSKILEERFNLNKEQINKYFILKDKQEKFDNKKLIGCIVGLGELVSASIIGFNVQENNPDLVIPIVIFGGIGVLTAKISATRKNPYYFKEYREIDYLYNYEKSKYKKRYKDC